MMADEQILYDLVVSAEWNQEPHILEKNVDEVFFKLKGSLLVKIAKLSYSTLIHVWDALKTQLRLQTSFGCPPFEVVEIISKRLHWNIALSNDGRLVALVQDKFIEIRSLKDEFATPIIKCKIATDVCGQWRKICWSHDNFMLAHISSSRDISVFDITGATKCLIPQSVHRSINPALNCSQVCCSAFFTPGDPVEKLWDYELFIITYNGDLQSFCIKRNGSFQPHRSFTFASYHPYGVSCVELDLVKGLLYVASHGGQEPTDESAGESCFGSHCGISTWRLLAEDSFLAYQQDKGRVFKKHSSKDLLRQFVNMKKGNIMQHTIWKLCLSPEGETLVSVDVSGRISVWNVPSLQLENTWSQSEQPGTHPVLNSNFNMKGKGVFDSNKVFDINWWTGDAFLLARANGCVTISSRKSLSNLLGESAERFDSFPIITHAVDGRTLVLECERKIVEPGDQKKKKKSAWTVEKDEKEEDEEETAGMALFKSRSNDVVKQILFFLTESERFLPPIKKQRLSVETYRLICLKSSTPEELYARKIELEHYGDALDLARRFNLNTDLVYQQQWKKLPVTKITIHDYLTKITDRYWVLDECLLRVPQDFEATEQLLKYGLLGTSLDLVEHVGRSAPGSKRKALPFLFKRKESLHYGPAEEEEVEEKRSVGKLSEEQIRLCTYRWSLLQYLDRLSTYEVILGGSYKARDKFQSEFFSDFRSCNIVYQAVQFAREGNSYALEDLFSYHGDETLPHWLPVISNFSETTPVCDYHTVVPEIGESPGDPAILPWIAKHHRETDWVEDVNVFEQLNVKRDSGELAEFIYEEQPDLMPFRSCDSHATLKNWIIKRAHDIEARSKQVDNAHALVQLGVKRGLKGLNALVANLKLLETLLYQVNIDTSLDLKECATLTNNSKLKLLMSCSTESSFVDDYNRFAKPFLEQIQKKDGQLKRKLVHVFLVEIARTDLTCCLRMFERSMEGVAEPVIPDVAELMRLAIDCIVACKRDDQLELSMSIVECLPSREEPRISPQLSVLHSELDDLERMLGTAEILAFYQHPQTIAYIQDTRTNAELTKVIIAQLVRNVSVRNLGDEAAKWNTFVKHTEKLIEDVYTAIDQETCRQVIVEGLLRSTNHNIIKLASEFLTLSRKSSSSSLKPDPRVLPAVTSPLPYDTSVALIVDAAREHFNASSNLRDGSMALARACLALARDADDRVTEEMDLIAALEVLDEFNNTLLPLQVRLHDDRFELIEETCLRATATSHRSIDKLLHLAHLLRICRDDTSLRDGKVREAVARTAFERSDLSFASDCCCRLVDDDYRDAWKICMHVGMCEELPHLTIRKKLLCFSLTYCPMFHLEELMRVKKRVEEQILYEVLQTHLENNEEAVGKLEQKSTDESILQKTSSTTKHFFSSIKRVNLIGGARKGADLIGGAMKWVRPLNVADNDESTSEEKNTALACHPFFSTECEQTRTLSNIDEFSSFLRHSFATDHVQFYELLFRSQQLLEANSEGEIPEEEGEFPEEQGEIPGEEGEIPADEPKGVNGADGVLPELAQEAIVRLSQGYIHTETSLCVGYLLTLTTEETAVEVFDRQRKNAFLLILSAYYFALQLATLSKEENSVTPSNAYKMSPKELLVAMVKTKMVDGDGERNVPEQFVSGMFRQLTRLNDLMQARLLTGIGKGVDVERFASDDRYKHDTIIGLAMHTEEDLVKHSLSLADRYSIPTWKILLAHVEFMFTDSGAKAKEIQADLALWNVEEEFKASPDEVFEQLKSTVYPFILGTNHGKLLLFYFLLHNSCGSDRCLEGSLTVASHLRLLKKIKAAASGIDYKELCFGEDPLSVIEGALVESNVHLFAKMCGKIPRKDGSTILPNQIFLVYAKKMFWQGEKSEKDTSTEWLHLFEACQKFFSKFHTSNIVEFFDYTAMDERSVDRMPTDVRESIANRILKLLRQRQGQEKPAVGDGTADGDRLLSESDAVKFSFHTAIEHVLQAIRHLKSLQTPFYIQLETSQLPTERMYARLYNLSQCEPGHIHKLAVDMFLAFESPALVCKLLRLADEQRAHGWTTTDALKAVIRDLLDKIKDGGDMFHLKALLGVVKEYLEDTEDTDTSDDVEVVSINDLLDVVRPFCTDTDVSSERKRHVLEMVEESFRLPREDVFLLVFYQTCAIVEPAWGVELSDSDINIPPARSTIFHKLLAQSSDAEQLLSLASLLALWSRLHSADDDGPSVSLLWMELLEALMMEPKACNHVIPTVRLAREQCGFNEECHIRMNELARSHDQPALGLKVLFSSEIEECIQTAVQFIQEDTIGLDVEVLCLVVSGKHVHRLLGTPFYQSFINFLLENDRVKKDTSARVAQHEVAPGPDVAQPEVSLVSAAASELLARGFEAEAGTLLARHAQLNPSLSVIDNAFNFIRYYIK